MTLDSSDREITETLVDLRESYRITGQGIWSQALWLSTGLIVAHATPLLLILQASLDGKICDAERLAPLSLAFTFGLLFAITGMVTWYLVGLQITRVIRERLRVHRTLLAAPPESKQALREEDSRHLGKMDVLRGYFPVHVALLSLSAFCLATGILVPIICPDLINAAVCVKQ